MKVSEDRKAERQKLKESHNLKEGAQVQKQAKQEASSLTPPTMAFSSCLVANGKAKCMVTDVAMNTRVGAIAQMLNGEVSI